MLEKRDTSANYLHELKDACAWLKIKQGRATDYRRLLDEFDKGGRSDEHILAYYESREIVELYELWGKRVDEFPGLRDKIRDVYEKGPVLRENETTNSSSNRPRNDAFSFLVAGKFSAADIPIVQVDGIALQEVVCDSRADFTFRWGENEFNVECKRPQSKKQFPKRAKEARKQITKLGRCGIIAIDCSVLYRPAGTLLETSAPSDAEFQLSEWLRTNVEPKIRSSLSLRILGFVLFARVPVMTSVGIINSRGDFFRRRDSISSWLVIGNPGYPNREILRSITLRLKS